jgi:hypothetical protein
MLVLATSTAITAHPTQRAAAYDSETLANRMIPFVKNTKVKSAPCYYFMAYITSKKDKTGFIVLLIFTLMAVTIAATDCEILNSGIPSIFSTSCCTRNYGITCKDGRVTEMYGL